MSIEHALLPGKRAGRGGAVIIGADSHTYLWRAGRVFHRRRLHRIWPPGWRQASVVEGAGSSIRFNLRGELKKYVSGKDVILHIIGMIGVDGALYQSMEFGGEGLASLTMDDRLCMANMAIEAGGKNGIFEVDEQTMKYPRMRTREFKICARPGRGL